MRAFPSPTDMFKRGWEAGQLRRRRNLVQEAVDRKVDKLTSLETFSTRGLTLTARTLSDDVRPRPHAGKKSRRTHARMWV